MKKEIVLSRKKEIAKINESLEEIGATFRIDPDLKEDLKFQTDYQGDTGFTTYYLGPYKTPLELRALSCTIHEERTRTGFPDEFVSRGLGFVFLYSAPQSRAFIIAEKIKTVRDAGQNLLE